MPSAHVSGTGTIEGVPVHFGLAIFDGGDNCMVVVAFGSEKGLETHSADANAIFGSIHKAE